jgi:hypothetical protein
MITRDQWRKFIDHPVVEWSLFVVGALLLAISPLVGAIPGPGGIIVAGIGLALMLKTSMWARRHYVRFKRWRPKIFGRRLTPGRWTDLALRRRSALRRERLRKERKEREALEDQAREAVGPGSPIGSIEDPSN